MTFKSFTTVDELFDLLVDRFHIQPPPKLTSKEHQDWTSLKQKVVRARWVDNVKRKLREAEPDN
jgi:son of sevenless